MKAKVLIVVFALMGFFLFPSQTLANAAEPPMITIIIDDVDLEVKAEMLSGNLTLLGRIEEVKSETYVRFYQSDLPMDETLDDRVVFVIETNQKSYEIDYVIASREYNQVYTLDQETSELSEGKSLTRNLTLIGMRLGLTLLIEALVFYLLGYREKRTWIVFFVVNMITQGWLNVDITFNWQPNSYVLFGFVIMEILILCAELVMFHFAVKEGKKSKLALSVFLANLTSLVLGGYLLLTFPL